jgi:Fur family zinc uptake transcriptional regulator
LTPSIFSPRTTAKLAQAEATCTRRGVRLTELRRLVLGLVLDSDIPAGAYELLDRLRGHHPGAAPPTVYRALDFLLEQGLVHKVERLAAFVGCVHATGPHDGGEHVHTVQFLICNRCRRVEELNDASIGLSLQQAANGSGFVIHASTVEADGVCGECMRHV